MTTKMITVYLTPKPGSSTFEPTFNSDTLFGAIATAGALLGYKIKDKWLNDENLRISNAFPFFAEIEETAEKIERTHYFPVPVSPMRYEKPDNLEKFLKIKKIKKLNWIPENEFLEILKSGRLNSFKYSYFSLSSSALATIVLNLYIVKRFPFIPVRFWLNSTLPGDDA